jgi:hypothetical protein
MAIREYAGLIRVRSSVKPLPKQARRPIELAFGEQYYVSFGANNAYPCRLIAILDEFSTREIKVAVDYKPQYCCWGRDENHQRIWYTSNEHILFPNEIGQSPEEAVRHEVG